MRFLKLYYLLFILLIFTSNAWAQSLSDNNQALGYQNKSSGTLFNPAISIILDGGYVSTQKPVEEANEIDGFEDGFAEGILEDKGFVLGHPELTFSGNLDPTFYGSFTIGFHENAVEIEEAFIETLALGLGTTIKLGRMLPTIGYLNEHHLHNDYFLTRPLLNQVFLGSSYFDDGIQISALAPTPEYLEIGIGAYKGALYPATAKDDAGLYNLFMRVGGDANANSSWRMGFYYVQASPEDRRVTAHLHAEGEGEHEEEEHADEEEEEEHADEEDFFSFTGTSKLYGLDLKFETASNRNFANGGLEWRMSFFQREEEGDYLGSHEGEEILANKANIKQIGWYTQFVVKFNRNISLGYRYDQLMPTKDLPVSLNDTVLDSSFSPYKHILQFQYNFSEFSRVRIAYTHSEVSKDVIDDQYSIYFTVSLGAHGAHKY